MAASLQFRASVLQKVRPLLSIRQISTSKKNRDTAAVVDTPKECKAEPPAVSKNWVSYGFDRYNEEADRSSLHITFFGSITMCLVFGGFILMYAPDVNLKDWAQREAFVELRRREAAGLLPIDRNLVDPEQIELPSDEDLGDTEIII